jgi:very-short-patch-repair endonuclease
MHLNNYYNKNLKQFARDLRNNSVSKAEKRIWKALLSKEQTGVRFLRQRSIDHFIVDFFAPNLDLIIEIDGSSHYSKPEYDFFRQEKLKELGFDILRFSEGEVLNQLDEVKLKIQYTLEVLKK